MHPTCLQIWVVLRPIQIPLGSVCFIECTMYRNWKELNLEFQHFNRNWNVMELESQFHS
ncbi:hypothetical protein HanIR_Chr05g0236171 [Helianthus annuus]|nr:hypothetical protein HanIR_Chr05g0236171 [Helianthus annuus]